MTCRATGPADASCHAAEAGPYPFAGLQRGAYRVICADPPWRFSSGPGRHPERHYRTMTLAEICALPVADLAHPEGCRLFMWTTLPFLERAFGVLAAWGFRYSTARVWSKLWPKADTMFVAPADLARGTGYEVVGNCEIVLIGKRGQPARPSSLPPSLFFARRREHSRKPDCFRDEVARLYDGPRVELFAREMPEGWDTWGNELDRFGGKVPA